ncbi:hypothetical protein C8Q78DRAFT_990651 [Trametes maxima]|nr:hypothetical protein C8Q78DRAFT_990651 [Trametes maxima]
MQTPSDKSTTPTPSDRAATQPGALYPTTGTVTPPGLPSIPSGRGGNPGSPPPSTQPRGTAWDNWGPYPGGELPTWGQLEGPGMAPAAHWRPGYRECAGAGCTQRLRTRKAGHAPPAEQRNPAPPVAHPVLPEWGVAGNTRDDQRMNATLGDWTGVQPGDTGRPQELTGDPAPVDSKGEETVGQDKGKERAPPGLPPVKTLQPNEAREDFCMPVCLTPEPTPEGFTVIGDQHNPTPDLEGAMAETILDGEKRWDDFVTDGIGRNGQPLSGQVPDWEQRTRGRKRPRRHEPENDDYEDHEGVLVYYDRAAEQSGPPRPGGPRLLTRGPLPKFLQTVDGMDIDTPTRRGTEHRSLDPFVAGFTPRGHHPYPLSQSQSTTELTGRTATMLVGRNVAPLDPMTFSQAPSHERRPSTRIPQNLEAVFRGSPAGPGTTANAQVPGARRQNMKELLPIVLTRPLQGPTRHYEGATSDTPDPTDPMHMTFLPIPTNSVEEHAFNDPEQLLRGMSPARIGEIWHLDARTTILVQVYNLISPHEGLAGRIVDQLTVAVISITDETDFRVIAPEPSIPPNGECGDMANVFVVTGLSPSGADLITDQRIWASRLIVFLAHRREIAIPRLVCTAIGFGRAGHDEILQAVLAAFHGPEVLPMTMRLLQQNPEFAETPMREAIHRTIGTPKVEMYHLEDGRTFVAISCEPPTISTLEWRKWRNTILRVPFRTRHSGTGYALRPADGPNHSYDNRNDDDAYDYPNRGGNGKRRAGRGKREKYDEYDDRF